MHQLPNFAHLGRTREFIQVLPRGRHRSLKKASHLKHQCDDAYRVSRKMLDTGHPPDGWDQLLSESRPSLKRPARCQESTMSVHLQRREHTPV